MHLSFNHIVVVSAVHAFLLLSNIPFNGYTAACLDINQLRTYRFFWAIINRAVVNIQVQVFVWTCVFVSLRQIPVGYHMSFQLIF